MAVLPVTLLNGTTADANDVMDDFTEIYTNIANVNIAASAGIVFSKLDSATVAGVTATQTLTNKTLTSPAFNGTPTFSTLPTFSAGINVASAQKIGVDGGGATPASYINGTSTTLVAVAGSATVFTANQGTSTLTFGGGYTIFTGSAFVVPAAAKIQFDGSSSGNTHIQEATADKLVITSGGSVGITFDQPNSNMNFGGGYNINLNSELSMPNIDPPSANRANRNSIIKAWARWQTDGSNNVTNVTSYNVSSITTSLGGTSSVVNWATDFASGSYVVVGMGIGTNSIISQTSATSSSAVVFRSISNTGVGQEGFWQVMAIGTQ